MNYKIIRDIFFPFRKRRTCYSWPKVLVMLIFLCFSCKNRNQALPDINTDLPLLFQSGFEPPTHLIMREFPKLAGKDGTLNEKSEWEEDAGRIASSISLVTTDGKVSQNFAAIIPEPGNPKNHVLLFQMDEAWMNGAYQSARVQCDFYGIRTGLKEFYQTVRIFLPEDFKVVGKYSKPIHWLTILELWNNVQWVPTIPYAFRITLGMGKTTAEESDLLFIVDAEDYERTGEKRGYIKIWAEKNHDIKVPIGEWFTMHYYFKEGNAETGRFVVILETKKNGKQTVFDVTNFTHNTTDPAPDGLTAYNPFKMYTSMDLAIFVKQQGKNLNIYWDDFKLFGK